MLKTIIFIVIAVALSAFAAIQFAAALEAVSATKATRDNNKRRSLELGIQGRVVMTVIFAAIMILLSWMSNIVMLSTIVCLILAIGLVLANILLKGNKINALPTLFLIWVGNLISSMKNTHLGPSDTWGTIYIILQVVCLMFIIAVTVLGNVNAYRVKTKREDEAAEDLQEDVDNADVIEEQSEDDSVSEDEDDTEGEDLEEEYEDEDEDDPFHEEFWKKAIGIGLIVLLIVCAVVAGYWLEWKFDFFPPYMN